MRVLMVTTEWPSKEYPHRVPFLVRQVELLRQQGVEVEIFHFEGRKKFLNYLRAIWDVRKIVRASQFDLVHAQWGQSAFPVLLTSLPLIVTFRGSDIYGVRSESGSSSLLGRVLVFFSRSIVSRRARAVVLVSRQMETLLPRSVLRKTTVVPSGINLDLFTPMEKTKCRTDLVLSLDTALVLFGSSPGRPEKRYELAAEAVRLVSAEIPCQLIVATKVPHDLMPIYLNAVDLVVLTSTHEGSPNIVKEALACNTPVVSVAVGDVVDRLGGLRGCAIAESTPAALASSIKAVLRSTFPFEGRESIVNLDEVKLVRRLIGIYEGVRE